LLLIDILMQAIVYSPPLHSIPLLAACLLCCSRKLELTPALFATVAVSLEKSQ
jgi:hypothetical protein